ncbi:MAG: hypothetical protein LBN25_01185, partial [Christensenellaceae bacterium]|nr:hypothetical protein [Christensenellaceae bacterium]
KSILIRTGKLFSFKTKQSLIISNLGAVKEDFASDGIENLTFNLNVSKKVPLNIGVISYGGQTVISFTRKVKDTLFEQEFNKLLQADDITPTVIGNGR